MDLLSVSRKDVGLFVGDRVPSDFVSVRDKDMVPIVREMVRLSERFSLDGERVAVSANDRERVGTRRGVAVKEVDGVPVIDPDGPLNVPDNALRLPETDSSFVPIVRDSVGEFDMECFRNVPV